MIWDTTSEVEYERLVLYQSAETEGEADREEDAAGGKGAAWVAQARYG